MQAETKSKAIPSVMALAYLGDARHSLYVRRMLVEGGIAKSKELNETALKYVTAEAQAGLFSKIENELSEEERATFKRAFNSGHLNRPKHASLKEYRTATGFEAVIGLLEWRKDTERLEYLLSLAHREDKTND
jgi:ribonuclease-3 family protein